jgi:hypothetical protein
LAFEQIEAAVGLLDAVGRPLFDLPFSLRQEIGGVGVAEQRLVGARAGGRAKRDNAMLSVLSAAGIACRQRFNTCFCQIKFSKTPKTRI